MSEETCTCGCSAPVTTDKGCEGECGCSGDKPESSQTN